jgi:hypothetical protein
MEVLARPKKALSSTHRDTVVPVSGPLPPEVLFHRYFPRLSSPQDRERYRGKLDLDTLPDPDMSKVLKELQDDFNMSFAESREALASLGRPLPVHLDYVDSHVANAIAFESDGYYFIGLTLPLLEIIRLNSAALMLSDQVWAFLDLPYVSDRIPDRMGALFFIQTLFVSAHEFAHHLLGHASKDFSPLRDELTPDAHGGMEQQAEEALADSFAVFPALAFLINSEQRANILERLSYAESSEIDADRVLLLAFLLCASSFLARSPVPEAVRVYNGTHPLPIARINGIIQTATVWAEKYRPNLTSRLTDERLNAMLTALEHAHHLPAGTMQGHIAFLASPEGIAYFDLLHQHVSRSDPRKGAIFDPPATE